MIRFGDLRSKVSAEDQMRGITEPNMSREIMTEQIGSATCQLKYLMRREEMITPSDPRASARICKKTP